MTHGISIRVILARYFRYTIDQFHLLANPVGHRSSEAVYAIARRLFFPYFPYNSYLRTGHSAIAKWCCLDMTAPVD